MRFWHWYLLIKQPTASVHPGSRKVTPNRSTSDRWARTERVVFVGAYSQRAIWFPTHYITVLLFWLIMHNNIKGQARREWVQKPQVLSSVENNNDISLLGWILMFVAWRGVVSVNIYCTYVLVSVLFQDFYSITSLESMHYAHPLLFSKSWQQGSIILDEYSCNPFTKNSSKWVEMFLWSKNHTSKKLQLLHQNIHN